MTSKSDWPPFCPQSGANHNIVCRNYVFCGNCGRKNPSYHGDGQSSIVESSAYRAASRQPTSQQRADRESTEVESPAIASSPPSVRATRAPTQRSHTSYSAFHPSLGPPTAQKAMNIANQRIRAQDARPNASSVAVSARPTGQLAAVATKAQPTIRLTLSAYSITLTIDRKGKRTWTEPEEVTSWIDTFEEEAFDKELAEKIANTGTSASYLLDWLQARCSDEYAERQFNNLDTNKYLAIQFNPNNNQPVQPTAKALAVDSIVAMIAPWGWMMRKTERSAAISICFETTIDRTRKRVTRKRSPSAVEEEETVSPDLPDLRELVPVVKKEKLWKQRVRTRCRTRS